MTDIYGRNLVYIFHELFLPRLIIFSGAQIGAEPQFSPLTPYQTADSLPPPVYGLLEDRSDIDEAPIARKLVDWKNHYGSKQKQNDEISESPSSTKRLSSVSSKKASQTKNWNIPSGAKLVGYNVQLIAGYVPTTYFNNSSEKSDRRMESRDSEISLDSYLKYHPGYNMNVIKNYDINEKDTVTYEADKLTTDTDDTRKEGNISIGELDSAATTFMTPIEHNLAVLQTKLDSQDSTDQFDDDSILMLQSNLTIRNTESTSSPIDKRETIKESQLIILQNTNLPMEKYNDNNEVENSTLIQKMPQLQNGMEKEEQEMSFFQQLQMNYTNSQTTPEPTEIEVSSARSLPVIIPTTILDQQNSIDKNRLAIGKIIHISESDEHEREMEDIKGLANIHVSTPSHSPKSTLVATSNTVTMSTVMMKVDSSDFDDENEDNDKVEQNDDKSKLENSKKSPEIQFANKRRDEMSEELNLEEDSGNVTNNEQEEMLQGAEFLDSDKNDDDEQRPEDSLPIQPAFPFGAKNQLSANPMHLSFLSPFIIGNGRGGNGQERRRSAIDSKKKQKAPAYDYDNLEDEGKGQFHEKQFTLSKNVPYE
uniref:BRCT domain-containing protein n=1 Tax=Elaeophora elaphi TaxID=1147741 RepID=A0A0R3S293_9BILA